MADVERIVLFIDGANLYATAKSLGFDIDYKRLLKEFQSRGTLVRAFYYTAIIEDQEYSSIRPLIDWLDYNGYTVVTKATEEFIDASGRRKVKGNMDIELAVDAMELAPNIDHMVLFSGDGDFRRLVQAVQAQARQEVLFSFVIPFADAPPARLTFSRPAPTREQPDPPYVVDVHSDNNHLGDVAILVNLSEMRHLILLTEALLNPFLPQHYQQERY